MFISAGLMLMGNLNHFFIFVLAGNLTLIVAFGVGPEFERWPTHFEKVQLTDHLFLGVLYLLMFAERFVLEVWRMQKGRWSISYDTDMLYYVMTFPLAGFALFTGAETLREVHRGRVFRGLLLCTSLYGMTCSLEALYRLRAFASICMGFWSLS